MDLVNTSCTAVITADLIASALIHHLLVFQGQEMTMNLRSCDYSGVITVAVITTLSHSESSVTHECRCHSFLACKSSWKVSEQRLRLSWLLLVWLYKAWLQSLWLSYTVTVIILTVCTFSYFEWWGMRSTVSCGRSERKQFPLPSLLVLYCRITLAWMRLLGLSKSLTLFTRSLTWVKRWKDSRVASGLLPYSHSLSFMSVIKLTCLNTVSVVYTLQGTRVICCWK